MILRGIFILAVSIGFSGCSLYQSDGRKKLEKNAATLASAQASMTSCQWAMPSKEYLRVSANQEAAVYASEDEDFSMAVMPLHTESAYSCNYRFNSAQEMIELTDEAIEVTLQNYSTAQSLGWFAIPTHSPLK